MQSGLLSFMKEEKMSEHKTIKDLICSYSKLYTEFEKFQHSGLMPIGDQKTGVIGEYYAKCYADSLGQDAEYGKPGEVADLNYFDKKTGIKVAVQVKCVSAHSKTRTIAPLNIEKTKGKNPFDYLYLIDLDVNFEPIGFYLNTYDEIVKKKPNKNRILGTKMKGICSTGKLTKGSAIYDFSDNRVEELKSAIISAQEIENLN